MMLNKSKKNLIEVTVFGLLLVLPFFFQPTVVTATKQTENSAMDFYLSAVLPDNQIDKKVTYFDLKIDPQKKQNVTLQVTNTNKKSQKIRITPTNGKTSQNGNIDYSVPTKVDSEDDTLAISFTSLVTGGAQIVEVPAGKTKDVTFELTYPEKPFDGMILGGFVADLDEDASILNENHNVNIVNKFQLVKAIALREKETVIAPKLELNTVKAALVNRRTAITANIQNTQPTMVGKLEVNASILKKNSKNILQHIEKKGLEMAPNSNFDFPIMWQEGPLEAGEYVLKLTATAGEEDWTFTKDFTVSTVESERLNEEGLSLEKSINYWYVGLLFLLPILVVVVLIFFMYRQHFVKKKKKKKKKKKINQSD